MNPSWRHFLWVLHEVCPHEPFMETFPLGFYSRFVLMNPYEDSSFDFQTKLFLMNLS